MCRHKPKRCASVVASPACARKSGHLHALQRCMCAAQRPSFGCFILLSYRRGVQAPQYPGALETGCTCLLKGRKALQCPSTKQGTCLLHTFLPRKQNSVHATRQGLPVCFLIRVRGCEVCQMRQLLLLLHNALVLLPLCACSARIPPQSLEQGAHPHQFFQNKPCPSAPPALTCLSLSPSCWNH